MATRRAQATRTVNPLHFEDLEPKRFEDLVRQLAYGFKPWRVLEPTGLLGDDEGIDILGAEIVADDAPTERQWRFQCKRYKRLPPKEVRSIVKEIVPDAAKAPHGLVLAAACNLTSDAILAFHEAAKLAGVTDSQIWSKAKLEDMLFRSENDHLLFAYFGISLRMKQRGELEAIRHALTVKRKLLSAFGADEFSGVLHCDAVVRDIRDSSYPGPPTGEHVERSWQVGEIVSADCSHLGMKLRRGVGWLRSDGTWDWDDESIEYLDLNELHWEKDEQGRAEAQRKHRERYLLEEAVPKAERRWIATIAWLPYSRIL